MGRQYITIQSSMPVFRQIDHDLLAEWEDALKGMQRWDGTNTFIVVSLGASQNGERKINKDCYRSTGCRRYLNGILLVTYVMLTLHYTCAVSRYDFLTDRWGRKGRKNYQLAEWDWSSEPQTQLVELTFVPYLRFVCNDSQWCKCESIRTSRNLVGTRSVTQSYQAVHWLSS